MEKSFLKRLIPVLLSALLTVSALVFFHFVKADEWIKLVVFVAIYLITGARVLKSAFLKILSGRLLDEEFLMAVASVGAFVLGEYLEAVSVMVLYSLGEIFQDMAVTKSRRRISALTKMRAGTAHIVLPEGERDVKPSELRVGDVFCVRPGEKIPTDGIVISGASDIDKSSITGEAFPVSVAEGESVMGGTVNIGGALTVKATENFSDSASEKIIELVENSTLSKSKTEKFITKFANIYTPAVVLAAVLIAVIPSLITGDWHRYVKAALVFLVVSCPCALVISVPMAFFAGVGNCSKKGLLVKGCDYLEKLAHTRSAAMDKTGTVTDGIFDVCFGGEIEQGVKDAVYSGERLSNHPVARAVAAFMRSKGASETEVTDFLEIPGAGISFKAGESKFAVGNGRLCGSDNTDGLFVVRDGDVLFSLTLSDRIKDGAASALITLKELGVGRTVLLSGDAEERANECMRRAGFDEAFGGLTPEGKTVKLREIIAATDGTTVFVGDGINDAPVLALADVGVAMGGIGQDAAVEAADAVLMNDSLETLAEGIKTAKKTLKIAKENIVFAIAVKAAVLALSVLGMSAMWPAIFADVGVCLLAILNSMRLVNYGGKRQ